MFHSIPIYVRLNPPFLCWWNPQLNPIQSPLTLNNSHFGWFHHFSGWNLLRSYFMIHHDPSLGFLIRPWNTPTRRSCPRLMWSHCAAAGFASPRRPPWAKRWAVQDAAHGISPTNMAKKTWCTTRNVGFPGFNKSLNCNGNPIPSEIRFVHQEWPWCHEEVRCLPLWLWVKTLVP